MSDNNLAVKITCDIVELQTKFAVAQAQVRGLTSEMNKLATASAKGLIDPAGSQRLQQVAGDLLHARAGAASLAGSLEKAGGSASVFAGALGGTHRGISMAALEFRALSTELSRGEFGRAPIAFALLSEHLLGLGPAGLIAVGAVGALTAGLGFLIAKSIEASNALDSMAIGAKFAGNLDLPRERLEALSKSLADAADVSEKDARKIVDGFARIPDVGNKINELGRLVHEYSAAAGVDAVKAGEALAKMFDPNVSAEKIAQEIRGTSDAQKLLAEAADRTGDANQVAAAKVKIFTDQLLPAKADIAAVDSAFGHSLTNMAAYMAMWEQGLDPADALLEETNQKLDRQRAIVASLNAQLAATPATPQEKVSASLEVGKKENPMAAQIQEATVNVDKLKEGLAAAKAIGSPRVAELVADLGAAQEKLSALQFGPVLDQMRTKMEQVAATWDGTQEGMLAKQRSIVEQTLAAVSGNASARGKVEQDVARLTVQINQAASEEVVAAMHARNSQIEADTSLSATARLEAVRESTLETLAVEDLTAQKRAEIETELNSKTVALARQTASEQQAIERSNVETTIAISKMQIEAQKSVLDEELAAHQINAAQKLAILKNLTQQEYALDLQKLQNELATLNALPAEYARVNNQILELKAKLVLEMAALDKQGAADAKRAAEEQVTAWKSAVSEIEGAETTMLGDLLSKRKSFGQSALALVGQLVDKEIEDDVRALTEHIFIQNEGLAADKASAQGGLLWHEMMQLLATNATKTAQTEQTAATQTGTATRTATETAANTGFFSLIAQAVAKWWSGETAKTGATTTGAGARTTTQTAADIFATTSAKTTAAAIIPAYAAEGAAAAGASVAANPGWGWALVPEVADSTFQDLMGYAGAVAMETGAWEIPGTMHGVTLHRGETVLPRPYAEAHRAAVAGDGQGGGDTYGDFHQVNHIHNAIPSADVLIAHLTKAARNFHPAFRGR